MLYSHTFGVDVQLLDGEADIIHGALDLGAPLLQQPRELLERHDASLALSSSKQLPISSVKRRNRSSARSFDSESMTPCRC